MYEPFHKDFGPLNLARTHKYIRELVRLLAVSFAQFFSFAIISFLYIIALIGSKQNSFIEKETH